MKRIGVIVIMLAVMLAVVTVLKTRRLESAEEAGYVTSKSEGSSRISDLNRIKFALKERFPQYDFSGDSSAPLASLNEGFTELETMEALLQVEAEFSLDITQKALREKIPAKEVRTNLKEHLSLQLLAELVASAQEQGR